MEANRADRRRFAGRACGPRRQRAIGGLPARRAGPRAPDRESLMAASSDRPAFSSKLSIEGVSKWFKTPRATVHALEDITLAVKEGEFVCLVGPSGCGKSTLLDIIAGLTKPDQGRVLADGQ